MSHENLTSEQQKEAKGCKTPDDLEKLAEESGCELVDETLEGVAGGFLGANIDVRTCKEVGKPCKLY